MTTCRITAEDAKAGRPSDCCECPTALAIQRQLRPNVQVYVEKHRFRISGIGYYPHDAKLPNAVIDWVRKFDLTGTGKPLKFELDIPVRFLRVRKIGNERTNEMKKLMLLTLMGALAAGCASGEEIDFYLLPSISPPVPTAAPAASGIDTYVCGTQKATITGLYSSNGARVEVSTTTPYSSGFSVWCPGTGALLVYFLPGIISPEQITVAVTVGNVSQAKSVVSPAGYTLY